MNPLLAGIDRRATLGAAGDYGTRGRRSRGLRLTVSLFVATSAAPLLAQPSPAVDVLSYRFAVTLSDASDEIGGEAEIEVRRLDAAASSFALDLVNIGPAGTGMEVLAVESAGEPVRFVHRDDRLEIALADDDGRVPGSAVRRYRVRYRGIPGDGLVIGANRHGERTFFADNWPQRARQWLPTVDHPADKALCTFVVTAPAAYQVVANGRLVEESDLPGGLRRTEWRSQVPISTKVMVIGVARFAVQHAEPVAGIPVESWVYPQDRERGFAFFAPAADILEFFVTRLGPFPYAKLASVQATTRFGGMENASAIFYRETQVTAAAPNPGLLAHEVAHQWFGDSVTEADWTELWLSEGFATYFSRLYLESREGFRRLESEMRAGRDALLAPGQVGPAAVLVPEDAADPQGRLGTLVYQKGAWVLHMLRRQLGDAAFWEVARRYAALYRDGVARSEDFRRIAEAEAGQDLSWFFDQWLNRPGQPHLSGTWQWREGELQIDLRQSAGDGAPFRLPLELAVLNAEWPPRRFRVELAAAEQRYAFPLGREPRRVVLDPDAWLLASGELERASVGAAPGAAVTSTGVSPSSSPP